MCFCKTYLCIDSDVLCHVNLKTEKLECASGADQESRKTTTTMVPEACDGAGNAYSHKFGGSEPHNFQPVRSPQDWEWVRARRNNGPSLETELWCEKNWRATSIS